MDCFYADFFQEENSKVPVVNKRNPNLLCREQIIKELSPKVYL